MKEKDEREVLKAVVVSILTSFGIFVEKQSFVLRYPINLYRDVLNIVRENIPLDFSRDYERFKPVFFSIIEELGGSFVFEKKARKFFLGDKKEESFNFPKSSGHSSWEDYHLNRAP